MRMCNVDVQERYSASLALKHPWITRKFNDKIPMNIYEENITKVNTGRLINVFRTLFFISINVIYFSMIESYKRKRRKQRSNC